MIEQIVDKQLLRHRLRRAHRHAAADAHAKTDAGFLLRHAIAELVERLGSVERRFGTAVAHGGQSAGLARAVFATGKADRAFRLEQSEAAFREAEFAGLVGDEEALPIGSGAIDLFVSALALQWTNDLPGALVQIRKALKPDGLLLAAMTGGQTLAELREALFTAETEIFGGASPRVMPAIEVREIGALLQRAGFALPVADRDVLIVRYSSAFALFKDLHAMGASNVLVERLRKPASRRFFLRAAEIYAERFSDPDGRVRASFEIVSISGWAPHASQQQPARRGSGQVSLAEALWQDGNRSRGPG